MNAEIRKSLLSFQSFSFSAFLPVFILSAFQLFSFSAFDLRFSAFQFLT